MGYDFTRRVYGKKYRLPFRFRKNELYKTKQKSRYELMATKIYKKKKIKYIYYDIFR